MRINQHQRYEVGIEDNCIFSILGNWVEDKKESWMGAKREEDKYLVLAVENINMGFGRKMRTKIMNLK